MLTILLGPLAVIAYPLVVVLVAVFLCRQGYCLAGAIASGVFTEIGALVLTITGVLNVLDGKTFLGAKP